MDNCKEASCVTATEAAAGVSPDHGVLWAGRFRHEVSSEWGGLSHLMGPGLRRGIVRLTVRKGVPWAHGAGAIGETFRVSPVALDQTQCVWSVMFAVGCGVRKHEKGIWWMPWH